MTSEERREAEEREKQAKLAKARMLVLLDNDEEDKKDEDEDMRPLRKKEESKEGNAPEPAVTKEDIVQPQNVVETKSIIPASVLSAGKCLLMNNIDASKSAEIVKEVAQVMKVAEPFSISIQLATNVSPPLQFVPETVPLVIPLPEEKKPEIEHIKEAAFPLIGVSDRTKALKDKGKQVTNSNIDALDAYMQDITREQIFANSIGQSDAALATSTAKGEVEGGRVITFDEIMKMGEKPEKDIEETKQEPEDDRFYSEFIAKLKAKANEAEAIENTVTEDGEKKSLLAFPAKDAGETGIINDEDDPYLVELEKEMDEDDFLSRQKRQAEKRELKAVNHDAEEYPPFRKDFYIEVPEIAKLSEKEVKAIRKRLGRICVRGLGCPKPVMNWYQCGLSDRILQVIERKGFKELFPVQSQTIPAIMSGKDVIAIAETGSGKTLAYVLPMLRHVMDQPMSRDSEGPIAVIMAPTRELANQIYLDTKVFTKPLGLRCVCVYGGAGLGGQLSELKRGCEIVVCTPGRMIEVLATSNGKITNLKRVTYIVLDEADRMLDLGFEPQIGKLFANIRPDRQTLMCSATFPKQIENLAKKVLKNPIEIVVGNRGQACRNVEQHVEVREEDTKFRRLLEILGEWNGKGSVLIFVDKHAEADNLFKDLMAAGYKTLVLHGGQDQTDREFTIADFKNGVRSIMVATSIAARGLDIKSIMVVINYRAPNHTEDYVHRVGRTGRAGHKGLAITFITPEECQYAGEIMKSLKLSGTPIPEELEELDRVYREKVTKGELEKYRPNGFIGTGYKFTQEESKRIKQVRKQLSRSFGFDMEASDSDSDVDVRDAKNKHKEEEKSREQLISERIKDPNVRQAAMDAAINAAKIAIVNGADIEGSRKAAEDAINKVMEEYKPSVSLKEGLEKVLQIRDDFELSEDKKNNRFSAEFEINDYPQAAKARINDKEFTSRISEFTGCTTTVRGVNVEPNKKPPSGQRRLYIHIEGPTKQDVQNAHKEVKRMLEDAARSAVERTGYSGRYTVA